MDYLGKGFSGLYFNRDGELADKLKKLFAKLAVGDEAFTPIVITDSHAGSGKNIIVDKEKQIFDAYGAGYDSFYLVRPDRHVCARWRHIEPKELLAAFKQALGET